MKLKLSTLALFFCCMAALHAQTYNALYPVFKTSSEGIHTKYRYGFINKSGRLIIDYKYEDAKFFIDGCAVVRENNRSGLIDTNGKVVAPCIFTELQPLSGKAKDPLWECRIFPDSIVILNGQGKPVCQGYATFALGYEDLDRIILISQRGRGGASTMLFDYTGKKLASYSAPDGGSVQFSTLDEGTAYKKNKKLLQIYHRPYGAITDMQGHVLIDSVDASSGFYDGYTVLNGPGRAAVVDTNFKTLVPFSAGYTQILRFGNKKYLNAQKNGLWGIIDTGAHTIVSCIYKDRIQQSDDNFFVIATDKNRRYTAYAYTGEKLFESDEPININYNLHNYPYPVKTSDSGYRLWKGHVIGPPYQFISYFNNDGYAYAYNKGTRYIIDTMGEVIFKTSYPFLSLPQEGIVGVGDKIQCPDCYKYNCALRVISEKESYADVYFYMNIKGKRIIDDTYERIGPFKDGRAIVTKNCERYIINQKGQKLSALLGNTILTGYRSGARIVADKNGRQALMSKAGAIISPWVATFPQVDGSSVSYSFYEKDRAQSNGGSIEKLPDFQHGRIIFQQGGKYGLMDSTGAVIIKADYDFLGPLGHNYKVVAGSEPDKKEGLLDAKGQTIIPAVYSKISYYYEPRVYITNIDEPGEMSVFTDDEPRPAVH